MKPKHEKSKNVQELEQRRTTVELPSPKEIEAFKWYNSKEGTDILSNTLKNEVIPYCLKNKLIT